MGLVAQEPQLIKGTFEDNITAGLDEGCWDQKKLYKAAKDANCYDFIMDVEKFPLGFKTELIEGGSNLSGGQK